MSFAMIIEDKDGRELIRCSHPGNEHYLMRDDEEMFPLLSNLNLVSYDVFSSEQAVTLSQELHRAGEALGNPSDREHIEELASLIETLGTLEGATITFTPFEK